MVIMSQCWIRDIGMGSWSIFLPMSFLPDCNVGAQADVLDAFVDKVV